MEDVMNKIIRFNDSEKLFRSLASKRDGSKSIKWFVGDLENMPIRDHSVDCIEATQEEIAALRKELTENNTQEVLEERIRRLKALLADYVSVDNDDNIIPELVVTAFVKQIIVFDDHFEWYLRTDASNQPIACKVKGRVNTDKVFTLSDSIYRRIRTHGSPYILCKVISLSSIAYLVSKEQEEDEKGKETLEQCDDVFYKNEELINYAWE